MNKVVDINLILFILTLKMNGINKLFKRLKLSKWIQSETWILLAIISHIKLKYR